MSLLWVVAVKPVTRYVTHHELGEMYSGDYDVRMKDLPNDRDFRTQDHPSYSDLGSGGAGQSRRHVNRLAQDISRNGMHEPIEVRGENVVTDGHHRGLAAMQLRMDRIPVHDVR